jgi:tripeptide aminopeptidase
MSDDSSISVPSTQKQKILASLLLDELKKIGIDASMDDKGYVYAKIPKNTAKDTPAVGFIAHLDTSPAVSGKNVTPVVHERYDGNNIILKNGFSITAADNPSLKDAIGDDIITSDGTTLLGADDKAGIAAIMDAANFIISHHDIKHTEIYLAFTIDEEIGKGMDNFDMKKFKAAYAYTVDGGSLGELETENFNADSITINIYGKNIHPGYAKDKMINAIKIASEFIAALPKDRLSPESTAGREGFIHPWKIEGKEEEAVVSLIARDFDETLLKQHEEFIKKLLDELFKKYPCARYELKIEEQYRNMKKILDKHPQVTDKACEAMKNQGIEPKLCVIRGGTDGSRLSFIGIPTANLFCGQHNFHSKTEYVSVQDMEKAARTIVEISRER